MPGFPCTCCAHESQAALDADLLAGHPLIPTAARYGVSKSALGRHRTNCLAPRVQAAARAVRPTREVHAPVQRARKALADNTTPTMDDLLTMQGLLETAARGLKRLENAADGAGVPASALAALHGQIFKGIETAGRLQGLYKGDGDASQAPRASIRIIFSGDGGANPPLPHMTLEQGEGSERPREGRGGFLEALKALEND